ncbi:hypothetical protein E2C01_009215 [Portunus trituberculatus]|uniref:Uncharacterized protein n=1 Tax=Portunus trituberculatus TaxID=210409 RepID=A0A5B7D2W5_PORTR|nr:hypothetical protein [Portunus trituberculatus]
MNANLKSSNAIYTENPQGTLLTNIVNGTIGAAKKQEGTSSVKRCNGEHILDLPVLSHGMPHSNFTHR